LRRKFAGEGLAASSFGAGNFDRGDAGSFMVSLGMLAALVNAVGEVAVPAKFASADLRIVEGDADVLPALG
jgi:hypothetical protein